MTYDQVFKFAEMARAYQDDFGKWVFRDDDDLIEFTQLVQATFKAEIATAYSQIQMLKTELAKAEQLIRELRVIK